MPRPAGGKQCMRQDACSTAQQHTPSSSSPGKTGLFFVRRLIPQPRYPPLSGKILPKYRFATAGCGAFSQHRFFASGQRHARAILPIHSVPIRLALPQTAGKGRNSARSRYRKRHFPALRTVRYFLFRRLFGTFSEGNFKTSINTNK